MCMLSWGKDQTLSVHFKRLTREEFSATLLHFR